MTDPYRPFAATPPPFPRERLLRAGVPEESVERLSGEYDGLDASSRVALARFVNARSDDAIRERFGGELPPPPPAPGETPTYEALNALTVDDLEQRVREWNSDHPDQHLAVSGRKGELIGRLLDAYEGEQQTPSSSVLVVDPAPVPPADAASPAPADVVLPTAPTEPTAGGPEPTQTAQTTDAAGAGSTTTEGTAAP